MPTGNAPPRETPFLGLGSRVSEYWLAWFQNLSNTAASAGAGGLLAANNLSDVTSPATARANLGLGSAATHAAADFDVSGSAAAVQTASLQKASNLSDVASVATARANLGLGSAALQPATAFDAAGAASSWTGDVVANAHNLSGVYILGTAGLQVAAFCSIAGTLNYSDGAATYMTSNNAGGGAWNEFSYYLNKGAALANDEFWISANARTTVGGADAYSPALRIKALTGAVTLPTQTTFSLAPVFGDQAGTRSALGLGAVATLATVPIANGGTGQTTAAAALAALGGAALAGGNSFSGLQTNASGAHLTGFTNPSGATTGGLELGWDGVESVVQSYKRSTSTYQPLWVGGSSVQLLAGGVEKARLSPGGNLLVGSTSDNAVDKVQVSGSLSVSGVVKVGSAAPATSAAAGVAGAITWDSGFLYVCVASNSWRRIALTTF